MTNGTSAIKIIDFTDFQKPSKPRKANYKVDEKQEVYPFRTEEDLQKMVGYFTEKKQNRNICMFIVGINVGLRAGDLLSLTWGQVFPENRETVADFVQIKEEKTGKFRKFYFNNSCKKALMDFYETELIRREKKINYKYRECTYKSIEPENSDYVFASNKGDAVDVRSAGKILKTAAQAVGIRFNVGTHSMRKTFGYWQLKTHKDDAMFLCNLQEMFNHSSQAITLRYCGLRDEEMEQYYNDVNLL